jgi:signal transduction histidine kinase
VSQELSRLPAPLRGIRPRDIRIAAIAAVIQIGVTAGATHHHPHGGQGCWWASSCAASNHLDALGIVLLALGPLALVFRRLYPRGVLAFVFAVTLIYTSLGYLQGPNYVSPAIAFLTAVMCGDRVAARVALGAGWVLFLWLPAALGNTGAPTVLGALAIGAWMLVLLAGAEAVRGRRDRAIEVRRARQQEARRRADEERLRIARELHDVLAHNISMINVQSGVALHLIDEQPEQARTALAAINEASADALREVRSALSVLRGSSEEPPRSPTAGLDGVDELVSRTNGAGLTVSLDIRGKRRPLPASVDLAAFRIVQESLTNVVRHADATTASVELDYGEAELTVQIDDDGRGDGASPSPGSGSGIAGMRERAAALGGQLEAGPLPDQGFRVHALLPLGSEQ